MSNDIVKTGSLEAIPGDLGKQVRRVVVLGAEASIDFYEDAAQWLTSRKALAAPGTRQACHAWMTMLVQGINGVTEPAAIGREMAIWTMCHHLPAFVWGQKTVKDMWAKTPFLPGPGEALEVLEAHARPLLDEIAALEKIAAKPRPSLPRKAEPYVLPPAPDWCFDRKIRSRSLIERLSDPAEIDDCRQSPKDGRRGRVSIGSLIDPLIAKSDQ